jgi:hypothetical protein
MERRNTITETNTTIAVPEIKLVERNRFREFVLTVTWPIRFALKVVLILFVGLNVFFAIRAAQPMDLPEARGMTFYQLMDDRFDAGLEYYISKVDNESDKPIIQATKLHIANFVIFNLSYYEYEFPLVLFMLMPENEKLEEHTKNMFGNTDKYAQNANYIFLRPRGETKWSNFLGLAWEAMERNYWMLLVKDHRTLRTVEFVAVD